MDFKIERGIPIPNNFGRKPIYPLEKMFPGDSFFVPESFSPRKRVSAAIAARNKGAKLTGRNSRFITRVDSENGVTGTRVWMVPIDQKDKE